MKTVGFWRTIRCAIGTALLTGAAWPAAVQAEWRRAESAHFTVYADREDAYLRDAALRLEKLDALQRLIAGASAKDAKIKPTVFLLADNEAVQATMAWPSYAVAGYYRASLHGPVAVNTRRDARSIGFPAQLVLFHELTHHFMLQYFPAAYPAWYTEGFADFVGSTELLDDGTAKIGAPVGNRYYSLRGDRADSWIGAENLLKAKSSSDLPGRWDLLYAEGWLLTHYLIIRPERRGQLAAYLAAINRGEPLLVAARTAFGDLRQLDRELRAYAKRKALDAKIVRLEGVVPQAVQIAPVSAAQVALMAFDIRLRVGIPQLAIADFAKSLRKAAGRFPDDPTALRLRVEADRLAGEFDDRALAIAAWTAVAPRDPSLLLENALLAQDRLVTTRSKDTVAWEAVRRGIRAALRADRTNVQALKALADSYTAQGVTPPPEAHNALFMALELVPQDEELRYALASDLEHRGLVAEAIATIAPVAYVDDDIATKAYARKAAAKERATYRLAGTAVHESPREMLERLRPPRPGANEP